MNTNKTSSCKVTIDIPWLPEGWIAVTYRKPKKDEYYLSEDEIYRSRHDKIVPCIIVEKIQSRRLVLEETEEDNKRGTDGYVTQWFKPEIGIYNQPKIWREVVADSKDR